MMITEVARLLCLFPGLPAAAVSRAARRMDRKQRWRARELVVLVPDAAPASTLAEAAMRVLAISVKPFRAAQWRGAMPESGSGWRIPGVLLEDTV